VPKCGPPIGPLAPAICYPHRAAALITPRRPQSGCDACDDWSHLKEDTGEPSVPAGEFNLIACRNLTRHADSSGSRTHAAELASQAHGTAAQRISPLSHGGRSYFTVKIRRKSRKWWRHFKDVGMHCDHDRSIYRDIQIDVMHSCYIEQYVSLKIRQRPTVKRPRRKSELSNILGSEKRKQFNCACFSAICREPNSGYCYSY